MRPHPELPTSTRAGLVALGVAALLVLGGCQPQPGAMPRLADSWYIQLSGTVDTTQPARVYDVDGFDTSAATVATLHAEGKLVVCYLDVGSVESYRPDFADFAPAALSAPNPEWPDERWLDILRLDVAGPTGRTPRQLLAARLDLCRSKGFDAVDPDMMEVYAATGVTFSPTERTITAADQLTFNRWVAAAAHQRGMSVGLKADVDQAAQLVGDFDFSVNEQCHQYGECDLLAPFVAAGKPVLNIEYGAYSDAAFTQQVCPDAARRGFFSVHKELALDAWTQNC